MTKDDKYFDDLFRQKLNGFEENPPTYVWGRIQELQQQQKRQKLFFYLKLTGAAAAVVLAFLLGWQIKYQSGVVQPQTPFVQGYEKLNDSEGLGQEVPYEEDVLQKQEEALVAQSSEEDIQETAGTVRGFEKNASDEAKNSQLFANTSKPLINPEDEDRLKMGQEVFSFLRALKYQGMTFKINAGKLKQISDKRRKQEQTLTIDDLEMINRNQQLIAMNDKLQRDNSWQLAAMVSPNLAVNQANYQSSYASKMSVPGSREHLSLGGGLAVEYKANKRWSFQSGVYYSQLEQSSFNQSQERSTEFLSAADNAGNYFNTALEVKSGEFLLNASAGVIEIDNLPSDARIGNSLEASSANDGILLTSGEFQQNFEYIEIPFNVRYRLIDSDFNLNLMGGFSTNLLVANDTYLQNIDSRNRIGETRDMNKVNYSTTIGLGFGYGLTDRVSIRLEPQLKYFLGSLNNSSAVSFKPYTIGVYTGLSYRF